MGGSAHHGGPCAYPDDSGAWAPRTRSEQNSGHLRNASQRTQDTGTADPADAAGGQYALIPGPYAWLLAPYRQLLYSKSSSLIVRSLVSVVMRTLQMWQW